MSWKEVADVLAREASYRAMKRGERKTFIGFSGLLRSNLLGAVLMTLISLSVSAGALFERSFLIAALGVLGLIELLLGAFTVAGSVHVVLSEGLLEPLSFLPVDEKDIRKAFLMTGVYWGGLSMIFALIPGVLMLAFGLKIWALIPFGLIEAFSILLLSFGIGYLAGSLGPKYTRSRISRVIQTVVWLIFFGFGVMFQFVPRFVPKTSNIPYIELIPPFSFAGASIGSREAMLSSLVFLLLSILLFRAGAERLWRVASSGIFLLPQFPAERKWSIRVGSMQLLRKELRLMTMNPRILASTFYSMIMAPIVFIIPLITDSKLNVAQFIPALSLFAAGFVGLSVYYLYVVEAEGALLLYLLPITRGYLARQKAIALFLLSIPILLLIGVACYLIGGIFMAFTCTIIYATTALGSSMIFSSSIVTYLPKEPSIWTQETLKGKITAISLAGIIATGVIALIAATPIISMGERGITMSALIAILESTILLTLGVILSGRKDIL
jgi:hypothetical protein